jgi:hypothetical protein
LLSVLFLPSLSLVLLPSSFLPSADRTQFPEPSLSREVLSQDVVVVVEPGVVVIVQITGGGGGGESSIDGTTI